MVKDSGVVDEDTANVISAVADAAENQVEAGRDASVTDRIKMASKSNLFTCILPLSVSNNLRC